MSAVLENPVGTVHDPTPYYLGWENNTGAGWREKGNGLKQSEKFPKVKY